MQDRSATYLRSIIRYCTDISELLILVNWLKNYVKVASHTSIPMFPGMKLQDCVIELLMDMIQLI